MIPPRPDPAIADDSGYVNISADRLPNSTAGCHARRGREPRTGSASCAATGMTRQASTAPDHVTADDSAVARQPDWWSRGGSNSRPSHCERDALPSELRPRDAIASLVERNRHHPAYQARHNGSVAVVVRVGHIGDLFKVNRIIVVVDVWNVLIDICAGFGVIERIDIVGQLL